MSNRRDALAKANEIDSFSTALINVGVTAVKRHPIPVSQFHYLIEFHI